MKKNIRKFIIIRVLVCLLLLLLSIIICRNIDFGFNIEHNIYDMTNGSQIVELGIPKFSFFRQENDKSYSYKNIRSNKVLTKEVKSFLNTLEPINCNDTTYYYDSKNNFSIIDYSIKNYYIYNTISYRVVDRNYCTTIKMQEYSEKLGGLKRYHYLNGGNISFYEDWDSKFEIAFLDNSYYSNGTYELKATLKVIFYKRKTDKSANTIILEESSGDFEIKDDKLYYYRKEIKGSSNEITVPEVSVFEIKDQKLILIDNYLSKYEENIILK
ncbi:MAG: hypothetical protein PHG18_02905 [Bacilli bacterium]|nr:hypothetical protein [Bacilli bacterium]